MWDIGVRRRRRRSARRCIRTAPLLLAALAVAVPARAGLVNVGGEGQLVIGAVGAAGVALDRPDGGAAGG